MVRRGGFLRMGPGSGSMRTSGSGAGGSGNGRLPEPAGGRRLYHPAQGVQRVQRVEVAHGSVSGNARGAVGQSPGSTQLTRHSTWNSHRIFAWL